MRLPGGWTFGVSLLLVLPMLASCQSNESNSPPAAESGAAGQLPTDEWCLLHMQGVRVGYDHQTTKPLTEDGRSLVQIDRLQSLAVKRFNQEVSLEIRTSSIETTDGQVVRFNVISNFGSQPSEIQGKVEGQELLVSSRTGNNPPKTTRMPWSADIRGFSAEEQSLLAQPLQPGERRSLKRIEPSINEIAIVDIELAARDFEETRLLDGQEKLLHIDIQTRHPGGDKYNAVIWTTAQGRPRKVHTDAMELDSYITTKEVALASPTGEKLDLGTSAIVKVARPLSNGHATKHAKYRVTLEDGDPSETFAESNYQHVATLGKHSAELAVSADGDLPGSAKSHTPPTAAEKEPNELIQSKDARVVAMAQEARGDLTDERKIAETLEQYVHRTVESKNFSQALSSAAEVALSREGDCTEHAVLLAALARACGIPARVAIGLVYVEALQGFGFHMWTEVYLDGHWVPLDATLGRGGIGAAHLKLSDSNLSGASSYSGLLSVAKVLGRLKIDVIEAN